MNYNFLSFLKNTNSSISISEMTSLVEALELPFCNRLIISPTSYSDYSGRNTVFSLEGGINC